MSHASGLAASIRGATDSDTFDLAGQNVSTITTNITQAFAEPFPLPDMIRITFVTGAGKLGRQKYDADAAKALTQALRDLGFEEDRGASCVKECAGSFKLQHDTGKNLKTVVVFPKLVETKDRADNEDTTYDGVSGGQGNSSSSLPAKGSPEEMVSVASKSVFENMVKSKCPSWSQKKACMAALASVQTLWQGLEEKLLTGTPLSDTEQAFYDSVSLTMLEEKQNYIKEQMHEQVDSGIITGREKRLLLSQVTEKLESLSEEIADAEKDGKPKKVEKLKGANEKLEARKDKLSKISPMGPHRLKHEPDILKLRAEMQPLVELEDGAKGRLLSLKETQSLARKDDLLEEIAELEEKSRGWFEDDDAFAARVDACNSAWEARSKQKKKPTSAAAKKPASSSSSGSNNAWVTTSAARPKPKAAAKSGAKATGKGGGVFAAMMMDSDSD